MCGIVAVYSRECVDEERLAGASQALSHRGPDAAGMHIAASRRCGLASRRWGLNDLEGGGQPLRSPSVDMAAVVNGEFYDFERIRAELLAKGHCLATRSDSEILLPLYLDAGPSCLDRLRGEFAFVLWDERTQSLFAARDRFGIKPLYYGWVGNALVLASEIKSIFAYGVPAAWNPEGFVNHLMMCHGPSETLFKGIRQLPPGHFLKVSDGELIIERYWDLEFPERGEGHPMGNPQMIADGLRDQLDEAVKLRMRADVPIGCFLSGGIDSAAVLALAHTKESSTTAFTVKFFETAYDECELARETAEYNGAPFVTIPMDFGDLSDAWEQTVWHAETIGDNARGIARMLQCKAVNAAGYKAALSGEGADEILGGYFFSRQDFLRGEAELTGAVRQGIEAGVAATPLAFQSSIAGQQISTIDYLEKEIGFTPSWIYGALAQRGKGIAQLLRPEFQKYASPEDVLNRLSQDIGDFERIRKLHPVHQSLYLWAKTMLVNMLLVADRIEMAAPVETRMPFLDHHVVRFAQGIPVENLFSEGMEKYPLRMAMRDKVPSSVFSRPKQPFTAPHALRSGNNAMREYMGDVLHGSELDDCSFFDSTAVRRLFNLTDKLDPKGQVSADQALMMVTSTSLLQRSFHPSFH